MNFIIDGNANYINLIENAKGLAKNASNEITQILFGAVKNGSSAIKSGISVKTGDIVSAELIDASASEGGTFTGIININGSLLKSVITEDLFNEFVTGKTFNNEFSIPLKLQLNSIDEAGTKGIYSNFNSPETQGLLDNGVNAANSSSYFNIIFKILNEPQDVKTAEIQKTLDLYGKALSENIRGKFETLLNSLGSENFSAESSFSNEIQNILQNAAQNISVSVKGNFAFIHIDFGSFSGISSVILTAEESKYKAKNDKENENASKNRSNSKKKYLFMIELNLKNLGRIKLFSYYYDKNLNIKFDDYTESFKKILSENMNLLKEMMSADGIKLNDISFKSKILDKQNDNEHDNDSLSLGKSASPLLTNINDSDSYLFLNGKIIDERV